MGSASMQHPRRMRIALIALGLSVCDGWQSATLRPFSSLSEHICMRETAPPRAAIAAPTTGYAAARRGAASGGQQSASTGEAVSSGLSALDAQQQQIFLESLPEDRRAQMVEESYESCRRITEIYAKTFYFGTKFFTEDKQKAVWAIYAWCRRLDDIVDKPRKETGSLRAELSEWQRRLNDIFEHGRAWDNLDLALLDTVKNYPTLSIVPFQDMIKGMVMDLDQNRFETFEELYIYCYRVAGTVGLMTMPVMGVAEGSTYEEALEPALALGVALQLTNILRDVGEDRVRQRIYLPQEDLRRFNVSEQSLFRGVKDEKYVAMTKFQIERAREWYRLAEDGIDMLAEDARLPVRASLDMYSSILNKIEDNDYDNFNKRAYTAKWEKLMMLPGSWLKVKGLI